MTFHALLCLCAPICWEKCENMSAHPLTMDFDISWKTPKGLCTYVFVPAGGRTLSTLRDWAQNFGVGVLVLHTPWPKNGHFQGKFGWGPKIYLPPAREGFHGHPIAHGTRHSPCAVKMKLAPTRFHRKGSMEAEAPSTAGPGLLQRATPVGSKRCCAGAGVRRAPRPLPPSFACFLGGRTAELS